MQETADYGVMDCQKLWGQALHFTSVTNGSVNCKA